MKILSAKKNASPLAKIVKENPNAVVVLKTDEHVEAKYLKKTNKAAFFDLGRHGTGVIYGFELINSQDALKEVNPGDTLLVKVVDVENEDGYIELSLRETHKQKAWDKVKELKEVGEPIMVHIEGANTGGLITDLHGLKAFLPVSQLSAEHYPDIGEGDKSKLLEELKKFVGETFKVKILDLNPRTNKLIISERALMAVNLVERLSTYKIGDIIDGIVTGVADFGAFVKFANDTDLEGLIHISELSHSLIENPKEILKIDDVVKAKIVDIKDGRVSLSLKALVPNPWDEVGSKFKAGDVVEGVVNRFNPFGAFIGLKKNIQGLIHVSEFGSVEEMKKKLEIGKNYHFTVEVVKPEEKRIVLKLKK